ncbi:MAG: diadenylate cyclase CdaA [Clostridia bacterium]|nr:TIGR00159 family protein [Oscillospiraceae bacterium]MBQ6796855.1 diadenylate cyclase CdaA [Clostridia bacterium]
MRAFFDTVKLVLQQIGPNDILDIAIVAFLIYKVVAFVRDSRVQLLVKGIIVIAVSYAFSLLLHLQMMTSIVELVIQNAAIVLLIVFHPEIRGALERMGRSKLSVASIFTKDDKSVERGETIATISSVVESFRILQKDKMGALVVFEREVLLSDIIKTGTVIDARPSAPILSNIFFNKAALHDGAVVIRGNKVYSAGCILPLTQNTELGVSFGTRHRAGIGISENSDAVAVILSEETGMFSVAIEGALKRFATPAELSEELMRVLLPEDKQIEQRMGWLARIIKKETKADDEPSSAGEEAKSGE